MANVLNHRGSERILGHERRSSTSKTLFSPDSTISNELSPAVGKDSRSYQSPDKIKSPQRSYASEVSRSFESYQCNELTPDRTENSSRSYASVGKGMRHYQSNDMAEDPQSYQGSYTIPDQVSQVSDRISQTTEPIHSEEEMEDDEMNGCNDSMDLAQQNNRAIYTKYAARISELEYQLLTKNHTIELLTERLVAKDKQAALQQENFSLKLQLTKSKK